jgi:cyclophilin family peptidyl-prolyl cis-trans isomerase
MDKIYKYALIILIIAGVIMFGTMITKEKTKVLIDTNEGEITIELYSDKSPISVSNFLKYAESGFYDGTVFHRVIKGFMIQGGGFDKSGNEKETLNPITLESKNGLKNERGTIAMARTNEPNSATSQFLINSANNEFLNYGIRDEGYAVFGKVISGMDVLEKIENKRTTVKHGMSDWPMEEVIIKSIRKL